MRCAVFFLPLPMTVFTNRVTSVLLNFGSWAIGLPTALRRRDMN
jgi:hypothetical protein